MNLSEYWSFGIKYLPKEPLATKNNIKNAIEFYRILNNGAVNAFTVTTVNIKRNNGIFVETKKDKTSTAMN